MAMTMMADVHRLVHDRVIIGAKLLDIHTPTWWQHVNKRRLNMASTKDDVLAQVYEDDREPAGNGYSWAVSKLRDRLGGQDFFGEHPVNDWLERQGFKADPFLFADDYTEEQQYLDLRRFWVHEVEARRVEA